MSEYSELVKRLHRTAKQYALEEIHEAVDALEAQANDLDTQAKRIKELEAENAGILEQLALRSESNMHKDMQEIMRINNQLIARIAELEAENAKLREALKQLHNAAQDIDDSEMSLTIREWWREELRTASAELGENDG
jgi:prefoldin subunit 5